MKVIESNGSPKFVAVGLGPGEKLLESIQKVIETHDIRNGAVVSGIGTLRRCHLHYVNTTTFPPENKFYVIEKPLEVGSISGLIANYEPHIHISVGCRDEGTWIGHLENDSVVLYLTEICILKLNGMELKREIDAKNNVSLLMGKK